MKEPSSSGPSSVVSESGVQTSETPGTVQTPPNLAEVSDVMPGGDQAFYQRKFMSHPHAMSVDTDCQLLCTVARNLDAEGLRLLEAEDGRDTKAMGSVLKRSRPRHDP